MKRLNNNEYCNIESFIDSFDFNQSLLNYIQNSENILVSDNFTYQQFRQAVLILTNKLNNEKQTYIYSKLKNQNIYFMIISIASILSGKNLLTHQGMLKDKRINTEKGEILTINEEYVDSLINDYYNHDDVINESDINIHNMNNNRDIKNHGSVLFYTSGTTTNLPKLIHLSQVNIVSSAMGCWNEKWLEYINDKKVLCSLPQFHVYEFIMELMFIMHGFTLYYSDVENLDINYMRIKPDIIIVVPQILNKFKDKNLILNVPLIISGGAPIRNETYEYFAKNTKVLINGYGSTETSASISISYEKNNNGICTKNVKIKIDENSNELLVKGLGISEDVICDEDGWYNTHDLAYITKDNKLVIYGRSIDIIKLQQGEYINLNKLSEIYSKHHIVICYATSNDRYPNAVVFTNDNEYTEYDLRNELNKIHTSNKLKGYERINEINIMNIQNIRLTNENEVDVYSIRKEFNERRMRNIEKLK